VNAVQKCAAFFFEKIVVKKIIPKNRKSNALLKTKTAMK